MSEAPNDANREPKRNFLWRKPRTRWWIGIPLGGVLLFGVGIAALAGFNTTMHETDSLAFCTSCHEMHDNMLPEYQMSPHFKNEAGVRAICSDCHVPKSFLPKMQAKISAALTEVPKWMLGTVGTKEKFTAVRLELAQAVWEKMKATDSRECRSCHSVEAMDIAEQDSSAAKKHDKQRMLERNETCIDCHKGIGHGLPPGYEERSAGLH